MSQSEQYYDPLHNYEDFNDSVILKPISLKPTVIPSLLQRGNPQNTILATYDKIKLTDHLESSQQGRMIQLISFEENSYLTILSPQGIQFLQRFSGNDIAFVVVTGEKGSGKSFFIDKVLNLSNVQGNNFSTASNKPAINVWSTPFVKEDLKFFIAEVSGCSPGSKQFGILLPYVTILSSVVINVENFKSQMQKSYQKLNQKLNTFLKEFYSQNLSHEENKNQLLENIFPKIVYKLNRNPVQINSYRLTDVRMEEIYLPNAKNPEYRGSDEDLRVHSFLNKKCINDQYIHAVAEIFAKVVTEVQYKKHRQLVFNGGIILKYLVQLSFLFNNKAKNIDIGQVYYEIVKDLYLSAYNYCVICYHESLEDSLFDQKPRSLDELINIFQKASSQILEKYNEFSLEKSIHQEYQEKLERHIESKQKLILEINKKKTNIQLKRIFDDSVNFDDLTKVWSNIQIVIQNYPSYSHGRDEAIGRKLAEIIARLKTGNNVDYRAMKEIQRLNLTLNSKKQELISLKEFNQKQKTLNDQNQRKLDRQKSDLITINNDTDQKIAKIKKQIKNLQRLDSDPLQLKNEEKQLIQVSQRNQNILEQLRNSQNEPIENKKEVKQLEKRLEDIKNRILSQQLTLKGLQGVLNANQNNEAQQTQMKMKKESSNVEKKVEEKRGKQNPPSNVNRASSQDKQIKDSKASKKSSK